MTDAEYDAQKQRILALIDKWVKPLGLGWWNLTFDYHRSGFTQEESNYVVYATCSAKWHHTQAQITFNMPRLEDLTDVVLERTFVHELCHVLVNEMREYNTENGLSHEERVCTTLENAFIWLRNSCQPAQE